jgi:Heparinase II/III-like protein
MPASIDDPFALSVEELRSLLSTSAPYLPELQTYRADPQQLAQSPQARRILAKTEHLLADIDQIPQTTYTKFRLFIRNGDREHYQTPYFAKRTQLAALALRLFLGERTHKDAVQDYLWNICEESNWVLPAHEMRNVDLFAAETAFVLAEVLALLGEVLDGEVRQRVRQEIEQRIFAPYLYHCKLETWYNGGNNWNGVCNSSIAATFLLLQPETMADGIRLALDSLRVFLDTAFEQDGSSSEGVAYWHYGLINFVAFAEMLRARSQGRIDLLASEQMRKIAAYPAKMHLSGSWFASFSDCDEQVHFNPGILARLAERTGEKSLLALLAPPAEPGSDWRLTMMLRNMLWWDGTQPEAASIGDAHLPQGGTVRFVAGRADGPAIVFALKAGHNGENHNQNDVGSFIVHVDGENLLTDPGRGLYSRFYFGPQRYENVFANSYGHSVPRLFTNGTAQLQAVGEQFRGELVEVGQQPADSSAAGDVVKQATVEFAGAYPVRELLSAQRKVTMVAEGDDAGTIWLRDGFRFSAAGHEVEEAFVTWMEVEANGSSALIHGRRHALRLTVEEPSNAHIEVEHLEEASQANHKPKILKRLSFRLPAAAESAARLRMEVITAS